MVFVLASTQLSFAQHDSEPVVTPPTAAEANPADEMGVALPDEKNAATPLSAKVIEVAGAVEQARAGVSVLADDGWSAVKLNDVLQAGTQIRTGLASHANLKFGTTTIVSIRSATHAGIDELYRSADAEVIRLGLGYGTVRGGSTEGEVRSDFTVDSTVATLAKKGTEGWQMTVEPATGRFRISLSEYGLVEAIKKLKTGLRTARSVRPGEYATDANIANMWIKQDIFDRNVQFFETQGLTSADIEFSEANTRGFATVSPGGGTSTADLTQRVNASFVLDQLAANATAGSPPPSMVVIQRGPARRPDGNFGTGSTFRVLVPRSTRAVERRRTHGLHRTQR